jgi:mannose-6-phosphate isomerase-like protein (cupin superfamily)
MDVFREPSEGPPEIYMGGVAVGDFKGLLDDLKYPIYVDKPDVPPYFWIGLRGAHTKMHYDLQDNVHLMINGRKRVFVADREYLRDMYPVPLLRPQWYLHPISPFALDRIKSRVDIENPDYQAFPRLKNVKVQEAELLPGEILYIPSCWWHELHNLESSIAINYWWRGVPTTPQYRRAMRHTEWARFVKRVKRRIPLVG